MSLYLLSLPPPSPLPPSLSLSLRTALLGHCLRNPNDSSFLPAFKLWFKNQEPVLIGVYFLASNDFIRLVHCMGRFQAHIDSDRLFDVHFQATVAYCDSSLRSKDIILRVTCLRALQCRRKTYVMHIAFLKTVVCLIMFCFPLEMDQSSAS